jgi:hypothetical protein
VKGGNKEINFSPGDVLVFNNIGISLEVKRVEEIFPPIRAYIFFKGREWS